MPIKPVILSGGSGMRLWPLSREQQPKQLLSLTSEYSLLQTTLRRLREWSSAEVLSPLVVCNQEHRYIVAEQLRLLGLDGRIILEPVGRGTAPAIALAAYAAMIESTNDTPMLVMPADHMMQIPQAFLQQLPLAMKLAETGRMVTFGIKPDAPETAYGYIELGDAYQDALQIKRFVEKPVQKIAEQFVSSGQYLWNSGIFMMRPSVWLTALETFRPDILDASRLAWHARMEQGEFICIAKDDFEQCPAESIDYAVMEKLSMTHSADKDAAPEAVVIPIDPGWSDVGSWDAVWKVLTKDTRGNVIRGNVLQLDCEQSLMFSDNHLLACLGLEDLVVVGTQDALLVARRDRAQDVKALVEELKRRGNSQSDTHRKVQRPWGWYDSVDVGDGFQVKRVCVKPHGCLSLQFHHKRSEHWVVVKGIAKVSIGDRAFDLGVNESTCIPKGVIHRLENLQETYLELIEVQCGDYLGEDDIVRLEDAYGRDTLR